MTKWEYKFDISTTIDADMLNRAGSDGWELVNLAIDSEKAFDKIYVFKREIR